MDLLKELENLLLKLCEEFVEILGNLRERALISQNEYVLYVKQKSDFIELYRRGDNPQ